MFLALAIRPYERCQSINQSNQFSVYQSTVYEVKPIRRFYFVETDTTRLDNIIGGTNLHHIVRHDLTGWRAFVKV